MGVSYGKKEPSKPVKRSVGFHIPLRAEAAHSSPLEPGSLPYQNKMFKLTNFYTYLGRIADSLMEMFDKAYIIEC